MRLADKEFVEGCKCKKVSLDEIKRYEQDIIPEMRGLMRAKRGLGLASPQVGINRTFFIMKYGDRVISVYNPKILFSSRQKSADRESCLTYPGTVGKIGMPFVNIMRPKTIKVSYQDKNGDYIICMKLRGRDARVFQHECEHLEGITIFKR